MSEHTLTLTNASTKPATTDANSTDLIYRDPNFSVDNDTYELVDDSTIRPRLYVYVGMWWNDLQFGGPGKEHDITTGKVVFETDDYEDMDYDYWEMNDEYKSYHESLKKGIRYYENGKLVYIQEKYGRTSYFDDEEKLIRIEFMKGHWKHGCVKFYAGSVDKLIRIEYSKEYISDCHGEYGQVDFYDGDTLLKTMFTDEGHPQHGEILYFNGNKLTRIEYSKDHKKHGEIQYYTWNELTWMNELTRIEYSKDHENHGEIRYYDRNKLTRTEFSKDHKHHGEILYYDGGKLTRIEYSKDHQNHGEILYYDRNNLTRIEYWDSDHKHHGEILYYDGGKLIRIEYSKDNKNHGQIEYYDGVKLIRMEYSKEHENYGEIRYYDGDKLIRIEYSKDHEKHGEICHFDGSLSKPTHVEFTKEHRWPNGLCGYGQIQYIDGNLIRVEFTKDHPYHGMIKYYDEKTRFVKRIEFSKGHLLHNEIHYYTDNQLSRKEYADGRVFFFLPKKKSKHPKSYCATCRVGSFVQQPDGWTCDNCFYKQNESPNLLSKSSGKAPTYYLDGEVPADKKRSEAETERLMDERKARRNGTNRTDTSPKTSPSKVGKQKVSFADISVTNPSKQLCNDIVTAEQHKMEKQCPVCGTWSSRTLDNNHISCECGIQFCFLCLTRVKGHKDAATGTLHFPTVCPQHGGDIVKPTAAALHKLGLGSSAKCLNMSEACFSVETNAIELGTFTNHAKERVEERGTSMFHVQTTKKYGEEVATMDSKGNASVMIVHRNKSGKVLGKVYESEDGSRVKTVV